MPQWFLMTDIWTLKNLEGYQLWWLFEKINFQGKDKLNFQSISPNEFGEVPPLAVKHHWAQCVKSNYNRMESFPIGEI